MALDSPPCSTSAPDWWEIILRTVVVYAALVAGLRLTGKRQMGQMAPFDLVVILLVANSGQNAMVGPDSSLVGGLISGGTLLAVNAGVVRARGRFAGLDPLVGGRAAIIMSDGKLIPGALEHESLTRDDLLEAIREHGLSGLDEVEIAVLEVDGTISVVQKDTGTIHTDQRFGRRCLQN